MKITVAGTGYVGLSLAVLLAKRHEVIALDIIKEKVEMLNRGISPIKDAMISKYLKEEKLNIKATLDKKEAYTGRDLIIIATPTNYDPEQNYFDTSSVVHREHPQEDRFGQYHLFPGVFKRRQGFRG